MIRFITGVPGAGKSYYAVNHIYQVLNDKKNPDRYLYIYTNINQFDFSISSKVCKYDHDLILRKLQLLHKYYKKKKPDSFLIRMARRLKIYKSLFVIDEAHNYFDNRNTILVWWLSYHRHLYHDIDLITQNLTLIDSKYKGFTEYFVRAVPQSLRLFNKTFKYNLFIDSRMSQKSKAGVEKVKLNPDVFKLYHSGDKPKTKNIILKFLLFAIGFFIVALLIFSYVKHKWSSQSDSKTQSQPVQTLPQNFHIQKIPESIETLDDTSKLIAITCISDTCHFQKNIFPIEIIKPLVEMSESRILHISRNFMTKRSKIYLIASESFLNTIKGVTNDNIYKKRSISNSFFGSIKRESK